MLHSDLYPADFGVEGTLIIDTAKYSNNLSLENGGAPSFACEDPGGRCSPVSARQRWTINANVRLSL